MHTSECVCTRVCGLGRLVRVELRAHSGLMSIPTSEAQQSLATPAFVSCPHAEDSRPTGCDHPYYILPSVLIPLGKSLSTTIHSQSCLITLKKFLYNLSKLL